MFMLRTISSVDQHSDMQTSSRRCVSTNFLLVLLASAFFSSLAACCGVVGNITWKGVITPHSETSYCNSNSPARWFLLVFIPLFTPASRAMMQYTVSNKRWAIQAKLLETLEKVT